MQGPPHVPKSQRNSVPKWSLQVLVTLILLDSLKGALIMRSGIGVPSWSRAGAGRQNGQCPRTLSTYTTKQCTRLQKAVIQNKYVPGINHLKPELSTSELRKIYRRLTTTFHFLG